MSVPNPAARGSAHARRPHAAEDVHRQRLAREPRRSAVAQVREKLKNMARSTNQTSSAYSDLLIYLCSPVPARLLSETT